MTTTRHDCRDRSAGVVTTRRDFVRTFAAGALMPGIALAIGACDRNAEDTRSQGGGGLEDELRILGRSSSFSADIVAGFERELGVDVEFDACESVAELEAKLFGGGDGFDVCVSPGTTTTRLLAADLLREIDRSKLSNFGNLDPAFLDLPWDRGSRFTVPCRWGMTGIAYRSDKVEVPPADYGVFLDARYRRKMTMLDDPREVIGAMLRFRGESSNCRDAAKLEVAKRDAVAAKKNLRGYASAAVEEQLVSGEVWVAQLGNGDAFRARAENPDVGWVLPKEGGTLWTDSMVTPKAGSHPNAALAFIDYVLRLETGAALARATGYGTPNRLAREIEGASHPLPDADEWRRLQFQADLGRDQAIWDRIWAEIREAD